MKTVAAKDVLEAAREYLARGWLPIPVEFRCKKPSVANWPNLRLSDSGLHDLFRMGPSNLGLLLGEPSGGLVDVDLDAPEVVTLAPAFLPVTQMIHGRESKPRSHWWYIMNAPPKTAKFTDPDGIVLVELRSTGCQTIVPPSVHPSGETITWEENCDPASVTDSLIKQVRALAACSLIARHWPETGSRHETALALAGGLLRSGWSIENTEHFVVCAARAAGDDESPDRARAVRDTADGLTRNQRVTGWKRLGELLGRPVVLKLQEFLTIPRVSDASRPPTSDARPWPKPLAEEAMHGLAGEVVKVIEPFSEADRVALLIHFLSTFGAAVGSRPHTWAGDARHTLRVWANLVGKTSKGRKGSAWAPNRRLFSFAEPLIVGDRLVHGLSSGEGLIWAVRDPIEKYELSGADRSRQLEVIDPGIGDKRLLVLEEEFASVLQVVQRAGNTLSAIARCAWDHGNLQSLTKNSPAKATGAHIVCAGHISRDELLRYLDRTEIASGFANRFIWLCTRRARELPEGGSLPEELLNDLGRRVSRALEDARRIDEMQRDDAAQEIWKGIYGQLSGERPGLGGAVTARAEAQVLRLSMVYAALDGSSLIRKEHLLAALAVWAYADQSVSWIFGDSLGDPLADEILRALRTDGPLSRNDLYQRWGRHRGGAQIELVLGLLHEYGKARMEHQETAGRPVEIWSAV